MVGLYKEMKTTVLLLCLIRFIIVLYIIDKPIQIYFQYMLRFHFWAYIGKVSKLPNFQKIVISNNNRFQWNEKNI